jgi:hypothetical protein
VEGQSAVTITWTLVAIFLLHPLPFVSMQGHDEWREFDCGPAAAAAVIEGYTGEDLHAADYYIEFGVPDKPQRIGYVSQWLIRHDVPNRFTDEMSMERLVELLADRPVIVGMPGHWETAIGHGDGAFILIDPWEKVQTGRLVTDDDMAQSWHGVAIYPMDPLWP